MLETTLLAFIIAKLKGYNISNIFKTWAIYPIIAMEVVGLLIQFTIFNSNYTYIEAFSLMKPLYLSLYLCLVYKYDLYRQAIIGSGCIIAGGLLNDLAIKANGGFMPVFPTLSYITGYTTPEAFNLVNDIHTLGGPDTKLKILTDFIDLGYSVLSIGDILIRVFVFLIIFYSIKASCTSDVRERVRC